MKKILFLFVSAIIALGAYAAEKQKVVKVKTSEQFINAIGSNRKIIVEKDLLDMTETLAKLMLPEVDEGATGAIVAHEFDGPSLLIANISNLTIEGKEPDTHIQVTPRYANVLAFAQCENISLKNLKLGHTNAGDCVGDVVNTTGCASLTIDNCKLYGCGVKGIHSENTQNIIVTNSDIYECSFDGISFEEVKSATFNKCQIFSNTNDMFIDGGCDDITFNDCTFRDNRNRLNAVNTPVVFNRCSFGEAEDNGMIDYITLNDCKVAGTLNEYYECQDGEDDYEGEGEGVSSYPYAYAEFSNTMKDITDYNDIDYFADRDYLRHQLIGHLMDYIETVKKSCDAADLALANKLFESEPLPIKASELLTYKKVRSIQFNEFGSVSYDFFNCRFYRENDELYFDKTSGSQRKWGLIGRIDDNNLAFTGCWYIGGDKKTYFHDEEHLQEGVIKKVAANKIIMVFRKDNYGYEIYELAK